MSADEFAGGGESNSRTSSHDKATMTPSSSFSSEPSAVDTRMRRAGWVVSALGMLFMAFDASMKLLQLPVAVEGTTSLGYPAHVVSTLGVVQLVCLIVYAIPRSAVLGAILWTGYLGGAVATHVRIENPLFSHILFPTYVALMFWGGLWLREPRLRALVPLRRP